MSTDGARSGVGGLAFAIELNKRARQGRILFRRHTIIAFERRFRLTCHVGAAGRQVRIHGIAKILRALSAICEISNTLQIATAAVPCGNRTKRPVGFANNVKPGAQSAIA
jgi:hypothetical protein